VHRRPRVPVGLAYRLAALRSWPLSAFPTYTVSVDDDEPLHVAAYTVVVANGRSYGAGLQVAAGAAVDDGHLDVVVIGAFPRRGFPRLLEQLRPGAHLARDEVTALRGRTVTVAADRPLRARADGEALAALPLTVSVRPGALRVRCGPVAG
jgi:diacylglycerol kinase (ATP)